MEEKEAIVLPDGFVPVDNLKQLLDREALVNRFLEQVQSDLLRKTKLTLKQKRSRERSKRSKLARRKQRRK